MLGNENRNVCSCRVFEEGSENGEAIFEWVIEIFDNSGEERGDRGGEESAIGGMVQEISPVVDTVQVQAPDEQEGALALVSGT